jgi:hypothetical protein
MGSPVTIRMLVVLAVQSFLTIVALFIEGIARWPWGLQLAAAFLAPVALLALYLAGYEKLSFLPRLLLAAAVLLSFGIAIIFITLLSVTPVYKT